MRAALVRRAAIFAVIFLAVNLAFDAYRHGGLTTAIVGTSLIVTAVATAAYLAFLHLLARRDPR